ncbi:bifunctional diaminohydroxyphosphoribosylaminopyrimidine deaminase/5-amino-6-(5-phosphoribosylamino)uracil reductase RibD [Allopusillimonas ginsengisoli]|uniref:bifunctional diaminohydroxyphosphoribosylaminopyrimidine deaminase/5-amino-6-(5-phosphoribosylamino)uracil reductase RibD n=1 Tax=Allopusillimonas ginsengisoli TaxID=453575 RepID=UPI0039C2B144
MSAGQATDDTRWMRQALGLAESVMYLTSPNPRVGCVIVQDGRVVGAGATQRAGGPHAEVMALRQASEGSADVAGSTVYVTLEPCSHHGRTPPCVDALIAAKPSRVVIAMPDPNPLVAGAGVRRLRQAGIQVATGVLAEEALALNPGFVSRMTRQRPWVWVKLAATLDGRIALLNGKSQWITGAAARADGHHWRARSCVVLTGLGTILSDDPQLNVRHVETERHPSKAVLDTRFDIPENSRIFDGTRTFVFTTVMRADKAARLAQKNVQVVQMPERAGRVDLAAVMQWLGQHDINEVHVEAGATLSGALLEAGLADELLLYMAPMFVGEGLGLVRLPVLHDLSQARRFEFIESRPVAPDIRLRAREASHWDALLDAVGIERK